MSRARLDPIADLKKYRNPIVSAEQYGLMQAIASGVERETTNVSRKLAEEMIRKTPKRDRSKFAKELARKRNKNSNNLARKKNLDPQQYMIHGDSEKAEDFSKKFHGRDPIEAIEITEEESYDEDGVILGDLIELNVLADEKGRTEKTISFDESDNKHISESDLPKLVCDVEGENLEIIGGDQSLDLSEKDFAPVTYQGKRIIPIGLVESIVYSTDKHHLDDSNGEVVEYEHEFGEDGGDLPLLVYVVRDKKLLLVGGSYKIEDVGIRN